MLEWMEAINQEVEGIQDAEVESIDKVLYEVGPDDNVVGDVSLDLRKLWILGRQYKKQSEEAVLLVDLATEETEINQHLGVAMAHREKSDLLKGIFWASIRDTFNLWEKKNFGLIIKKGWKIVSKEVDSEHSCLACTMTRVIVKG